MKNEVDDKIEEEGVLRDDFDGRKMFEGGGMFRFRHRLLKDAVSERMAPTDLRWLHAEIARVYEESHQEDLSVLFLADASPPMSNSEAKHHYVSLRAAWEIASHLDLAGESARAARWFVDAGNAAAELFLNAEASAAYGRAIEIVEAAHPVRL